LSLKNIIKKFFSVTNAENSKIITVLGIDFKIKKRKNSKSRHFIIEISGICNSKCPYCCTGSGNHKTNRKFMPAETFDKTIKHLIKIKLLFPKRTQVSLYNWGEPFLNPEINDILNSLGQHGLTAGISSNFIKMPDLKPESYKNISSVIFSICSLDPNEYKRIYGADLEKVLNNFNQFLEYKNKYNPGMFVDVHWIKYKFNDTPQEQSEAKKYFNERGVNFNIENFYAYLADGYALIKYISEGVLDGYEIEKLKKDVDLDRIKHILKEYAPENYYCTLKDVITINEMGQLATCCVITSKNKEYNLGSILDLDYKQIMKLKQSSQICSICDKTKLPWYYEHGFSKTIEELQDLKK